MVFRLIMQYARTLPWTRNMMQNEAATVDNRHQSTIWIVTDETCAWVWLQVPNPVCLSQPIMHVWFSDLTESFVVGIFGCSMLFQNAMQVLNFPCSSGCQSDHGSHWCFWFLSSEIGNSSPQGHLMHKINCHLRFLHVQHVLLDSVGVSVCLSGTLKQRSSPWETEHIPMVANNAHMPMRTISSFCRDQQEMLFQVSPLAQSLRTRSYGASFFSGLAFFLLATVRDVHVFDLYNINL